MRRFDDIYLSVHKKAFSWLRIPNAHMLSISYIVVVGDIEIKITWSMELRQTRLG